MLPLYVCSFGVMQLTLGVLAELNFHQSDYNLKFEWAEVGGYNKRLTNKCEVHVFKYNRTCTAANFTFEYKIDVGNDVSIIMQAYKFASNEYRLFPIRFQLNFCEGLRKNYAGALRSLKCGNFTGCPNFKGVRYHSCNWTPDQAELPPFIPSGRYKLVAQGVFHDQELWVVNAYGEIYRPIVSK